VTQTCWLQEQDLVVPVTAAHVHLILHALHEGAGGPHRSRGVSVDEFGIFASVPSANWRKKFVRGAPAAISFDVIPSQSHPHDALCCQAGHCSGSRLISSIHHEPSQEIVMPLWLRIPLAGAPFAGKFLRSTAACEAECHEAHPTGVAGEEAATDLRSCRDRGGASA